MRHGKLRGGAVVVLMALALTAGACSGCADGVFDRMDEWLRDDPERPGKVGTLRALEVRQTATKVAEAGRRSDEGPCGIGWEFSEPFSVSFELAIDVERREGRKRWEENGLWRRDEEGRWEIEVMAEFEGDDELEGERSLRVFSGEERFLEWLGPEAVAEYGPDSEAETSWKNEFASRFSALLDLHASGWAPSGEGERWEEVWRPGDRRYWCGPVEASEEMSAWKAIFDARTTLDEVEVAVGGTSGEDGERGEETCRRLEARHELRAGGTLEVTFRECHRTGPEALESPEVERIAEVSRGRQRARADAALAAWIDEGIAEPNPREEH